MVPYWPQIHICSPRWFFLELPNKAMSLLNVSTSMHNPAAALSESPWPSACIPVTTPCLCATSPLIFQHLIPHICRLFSRVMAQECILSLAEPEHRSSYYFDDLRWQSLFSQRFIPGREHARESTHSIY